MQLTCLMSLVVFCALGEREGEGERVREGGRERGREREREKGTRKISRVTKECHAAECFTDRVVYASLR